MEWKKSLNSKMEQVWRFFRFVVVHFFEDDCPYRASALAFTSLLAVVPLMTVGFTILSSFPVVQSLSQPVQDFIFDNFVPSTGKVLQTYMEQFTTQVSKLSIWGIAFLFATALLLMVTIEHSMNKIWRTNNSRHGVSALLLYWAILSLAPVFLGLSLAVSSYLVSIPFQNNVTPSIFVSSISYPLSLIGFTSFYIVVPNCPVKIKHALVGGLVTTIFFESAKAIFAMYLYRFHFYELLYGAFAIIPLFFIWIYWVWFIILLGAEVSYALSVHHKRRMGQPLDGFSHALLWLKELWSKQKEGKGVTVAELIAASDQPFSVDSDFMINELKRLNLIHSNEDGEFLLSRDLSDVSLYWLSQQLPFCLPSQSKLNEEDPSCQFMWHKAFEESDLQLKKNLAITLAELFHEANSIYPKP